MAMVVTVHTTMLFPTIAQNQITLSALSGTWQINQYLGDAVSFDNHHERGHDDVVLFCPVPSAYDTSISSYHLQEGASYFQTSEHGG
jgi:hypothetical protein